MELKEGDRGFLSRAAINHWTFRRAPEGWRIVERFNRARRLGGKPRHRAQGYDDMSGRFEAKVAIIAGASTGLGPVMART